MVKNGKSGWYIEQLSEYIIINCVGFNDAIYVNGLQKKKWLEKFIPNPTLLIYKLKDVLRLTICNISPFAETFNNDKMYTSRVLVYLLYQYI